MRLVVIIVCPDCHRSREVTISGPFDVLDVKHDCGGIDAFQIERGVRGEQLAMTG